MTITAQLMRDSGEVGNDYSRQATAVERYLVEQDTGDAITGYSEIVATGLLPKFGTRYPGTSAVCSKYDAEPDPRNRAVWYVTVTYSTRNAEFSRDGSEDPIKQPARVFYNLRKYNQVAEFAYKSGDDRGDPTDPVENTAGDRFSPMPTVEEHDLVVIVEKNYRDFDPGDIKFFQGTINKGEVTIGGVKFAPDEAWMSKISHRLMFDDDGDPYDRMHFEIIQREGGWKKIIVSNGFRYKDSQGTLRKIRERHITNEAIGQNEGAQPISSPVALDSGGDPAVATGNDPVKLEFRFKWREDWSKLDLPVRKDGRR